MPAISDPKINGNVWWTPLFPSRMSASHGPTPAAFPRTRSCPPPGSGRGTSVYFITSRDPYLEIRTAFIWLGLFEVRLLIPLGPAGRQINFNNSSIVSAETRQNMPSLRACAPDARTLRHAPQDRLAESSGPYPRPDRSSIPVEICHLPEAVARV